MAADVEQCRRSEERAHLIDGSLQVFRLLLSNDQARRPGLTNCRDRARALVLVRLFHDPLPSTPALHKASSKYTSSTLPPTPQPRARTYANPERDSTMPCAMSRWTTAYRHRATYEISTPTMMKATPMVRAVSPPVAARPCAAKPGPNPACRWPR